MKYVNSVLGVRLLLPLMLLILAGCGATGKYTTPAPEQNMQVKEDKAAIVFMRASGFGGAITSPLVSVDDEGNSSLVGILGPSEKMVHYVDPGSYQFMVIGENADFMKANVEAGKAYYAIIRPRMGVWKARFSVTPFKAAPEKPEFSTKGNNLKEWSKACQYTLPNQAAQQWVTEKQGELKERFNEYMPKWKTKTQAQQTYLTLEAEDGFDDLSI